MDPVIENTDLDPPRPTGILMRGLPVAVVAHVLLAVALAWGVQWKRQPDPAAAAVPLPPVTAAAPSTATMGAAPSTATMGGAPAPRQAAPSPPAPAAASPQPPARQADTRVAVLQPRPPAAAPAPAERVQPSFDCNKARSTPERLICADAELSRMDRELGRLYARAREAAPDPAAFRRHSDAQWFQRERECRDKECLMRWYAMRREQLMASLGEAPARR